jgi:hypothetical protein
MSLKLILLGIGVTSASALALWLWILLSVNPLEATRFELALFYLTTAIWLIGFFTLSSFYIRLFRSRNEFYYGNLFVSLRQGALFSGFTTLALLLLAQRAVGWVEILLLFCAVVFFELYFSAKK